MGIWKSGRNPDYYIKDSKKKSIAVFKTPFTRNDYNFIANEDGMGEKFGIHDGQTGEIKFYDLGNGITPNFTNLFDMDFDFSLFKSAKYLGLGVLVFWAYRLSRVKPSNPLRTSKETQEFLDDLLSKTERPNPNVMHMGEGNGFKEAD